MVIAHHLIWTAYGWWLPNDPRGSASHLIRSDVIADLGELHYGRKRVQPASSEIRTFYENAKQLLKHELQTFSPAEIALIADAFADEIHKRNYTCYACAIMPDHIHILIRKHRDRAEDMIAHFQEASRTILIESAGRANEHPVWGGPGWKVFLESREDIERTIGYIDDNPRKARLPAQAWKFVTRYDGWLPGLVTKRRPDGR